MHISIENIALNGVPQFISLLQLINSLTWNEVDCSKRNGLITGYSYCDNI